MQAFMQEQCSRGFSTAAGEMKERGKFDGAAIQQGNCGKKCGRPASEPIAKDECKHIVVLTKEVRRPPIIAEVAPVATEWGSAYTADHPEPSP